MTESEGYPVRVQGTGYIQYIDPEYMLTLAGEKDLVIRLLRKPGHFVWSGTVVALVWPAGRIDQQLDKQLRRAFRLGNQRSPTQDVDTRSPSWLKWQYAPCLRRSMTPSPP